MFQSFGFDLLRSAGVLMSPAGICELISDESDGPHQKGVCFPSSLVFAEGLTCLRQNDNMDEWGASEKSLKGRRG